MRYDLANWQSLTEAEHVLVENAGTWFAAQPPYPRPLSTGEIVDLYLKENGLTVEDYCKPQIPLLLVKQIGILEV